MVNFFSYFLTCSNHSTLNDVVSKYLLVFFLFIRLNSVISLFGINTNLNVGKANVGENNFQSLCRKILQHAVEYLFL